MNLTSFVSTKHWPVDVVVNLAFPHAVFASTEDDFAGEGKCVVHKCEPNR